MGALIVRMTVAYDGSHFRGFARQDGGVVTVQGAVEEALALVLGEAVVTTGAGRTDAGVHASGQVMSFAVDGPLPSVLARRLSRMLAPGIAVLDVTEAPPGFDARFSARFRRYRYRILTRSSPDPLRRHVVWHLGRPLDVVSMAANAAAAVGEHDFSSFCRVAAGRHARRKVLAFTVVEAGDEVHAVITATAFCHQMVRSLVGAVVEGRSVAVALAVANRAAAGQMAPPHGLCLEAVGY